MRLERAGQLHGPLTNSPVAGADVVDGHGQLWDVKSPQDVKPGKGMYTLRTTLTNIREDVRTGEHVIVNIGYLSREHAHELIAVVRADPALQGRVLFSTSARW